MDELDGKKVEYLEVLRKRPIYKTIIIWGILLLLLGLIAFLLHDLIDQWNTVPLRDSIST